ncbi:MAG TPA: hypothetical protein VHV51_15460 [Polyangiaceae bacterium]|nr:hypothetical protein [Polyangiaceae bacterium]
MALPAGGRVVLGGAGRDSDAGSSPAHAGNTNGSGGNAPLGNGGTSGDTALGGNSQGGLDTPCLSGDSCVGDGGVRCPPTVSSCTRCAKDNDCGGDAPPYCDVADGRCVECRPNRGDCKPGDACDPIFLRCAKACEMPNDCDHPQQCSLARGVCVDCVTSSDCEAIAGQENYHCFAGFCVECSVDASCSDPTPVCVSYHCVARQ